MFNNHTVWVKNIPREVFWNFSQTVWNF